MFYFLHCCNAYFIAAMFLLVMACYLFLLLYIMCGHFLQFWPPCPLLCVALPTTAFTPDRWDLTQPHLSIIVILVLFVFVSLFLKLKSQVLSIFQLYLLCLISYCLGYHVMLPATFPSSFSRCSPVCSQCCAAFLI